MQVLVAQCITLQHNASHCITHEPTMKAITVRIDEEQERKLDELKDELHNSDAGVVRFALDQLYKALKTGGPIPQHTGDVGNAAA